MDLGLWFHGRQEGEGGSCPMNNTRQRSNEIQAAARVLVSEVGIGTLDSYGEWAKYPIADLQKRLMAEVGTDRVTARRHIAKALEFQRTGEAPPDNWGGNRKG